MVHTLMSDDEDTWKNGERIGAKYMSRPPVYQSDKVRIIIHENQMKTYYFL